MGNSTAVVLETNALTSEVCGANDANLKVLEELLGIRILSRGNELYLESEDPNTQKLFHDVLGELQALARGGRAPGPEQVRTIFESLSESADVSPSAMRETKIEIPGGFGVVHPRGATQTSFIRGMDTHEMSFCIGPAGTGKTFLAVAHALADVLARRRRKLVLTRPVVEAGENLGFLPGDLTQKINPYLRPLYDAMEALIPVETITRMESNRIIEIAPLAYMRGRSLRDCYIILDEAQNTTREQMKMFLTRLGENSKAIVTGDVTQIDLGRKEDSGLVHAISILSNLEEIYICRFGSRDVVRNPLVRKIVAAYEAS